MRRDQLPLPYEYVIYRLSLDKRNPKQIRLDAYKVVDGERLFMGTLDCRKRASALGCTGHTAKKDDWEFKIDGDTMSGTLTIDDSKTLYRKVNVRRKLRERAKEPKK